MRYPEQLVDAMLQEVRKVCANGAPEYAWAVAQVLAAEVERLQMYEPLGTEAVEGPTCDDPRFWRRELAGAWHEPPADLQTLPRSTPAGTPRAVFQTSDIAPGGGLRVEASADSPYALSELAERGITYEAFRHVAERFAAWVPTVCRAYDRPVDDPRPRCRGCGAVLEP